jgi:hypothetical protein
VGGAVGSIGTYSFDVFLNSALEEESYVGPANDDIDSAQSVDSSFIQLPGGGQRGAVLGRTATLSGSIAEIEPNDNFWSAQDIDGGSWNVDFDPYIDESTVRPHISIQGTGDNSYDYYAFTVSTAGEYGIFDIDLSSGLDSWLDISDGFGNILYSSDDAGYDNGSYTGLDSLISYEFPAAGTYYVRVASCCDQPVQIGSAYTLQISLANHPVNPPSGSADTYSVSLDANQAVTIIGTSLTGGNIDISLLDNDGSVVASGTDDDLADVIDFSVGSSGIYYIQVSGDSAVEYSLVVTQSEAPGEGAAPHLADGARSSAVAEFVWCNARESHDVNDDGRVSPLDALAIINSLNAEGTRQLPSDSVSEPARLFYDVNRDGFISPRDALQVVNYLNAGGNSRTVGENAEVPVSDPTVDEQVTPAIPRVTDSAAKVVVKDTRPAAAFEFVTPPADCAPPLSVDSTTSNDKAMSADFWSDPDLRWVSDDKSSELDALTQEAMSQATATRRQLELQYRERLFEAYGRQRVGSGL